MSGVWDNYSARMNKHGTTKRSATFNRAVRDINRRLPKNLSYKSLTIDGVASKVGVLNTDQYNKKKIISMPGETYKHGAKIEWMNQHWIVTEKDYDTELYTSGYMIQCNYLLKWVDKEDHSIQERWCVVDDGTKNLTGEYSDRDFFVTRGDLRVSIIIPKDEYTLKLNRESRFIIDDYDSEETMAYRLTKPLRLGGSYDSYGVLSFVLFECGTEDDDNLELHIADYYKYFPRENAGNTTITTNSHGKTGWL